MKVFAFLSRQKLLTSLLITALLFILFFSLFNVRFETNDDPTIMMISSGILTGEPCEYLITINIIIGNILKLLYTSFPAVNWYPLFWYSIHFTGVTFLLYSLLYQEINRFKMCLFLLFFLFSESYFLMNLQYTTTASVAGISGLFLLMAVLKKEGKINRVSVITGIFLVFLCSLIRSEVFHFISLLSLPLWICFFLENKSRKFLFSLFLIIILYFFGYLYNRGCYAGNKEWSEFVEYLNLHRKLIDSPVFSSYTPLDPVKKDACNQVEWSDADAVMFVSWFCLDKEVYSKEKLERLLKIIPPWSRHSLPVLLKKVFAVFLNPFILACLCLVLFILITDSDFRFRYIFFSFLWALGILLYLEIFLMLKPRLYLTVIFFLTYSAIFFSSGKSFLTSPSPEDNRETPEKLREKIIFKRLLKKVAMVISGLILACFTLFCIYGLFRESSVNKMRNIEYMGLIKALSGEDKLYVIWGHAMNSENTGPFVNLKELEKFNRVDANWTVFSPTYYRMLEKFQIRDVYKALYEKDNVYLIALNDRFFLTYLQIFIKEHYNEDILFEPLLVWYDNSRCVFKVYREGDKKPQAQ